MAQVFSSGRVVDPRYLNHTDEGHAPYVSVLFGVRSPRCDGGNSTDYVHLMLSDYAELSDLISCLQCARRTLMQAEMEREMKLSPSQEEGIR